MTKLTVITVAIAGALLVAISGAKILPEVTPYLVGGISPDQRFMALAAGDLQPADSRWSKDLYIDECLDVPRSTYGIRQPAARMRSLLVNCRSAAQEVVGSAPTKSSAWLVLASTSADLGDFATMRTSLAISKRTAPTLLWLVERRTALAEKYRAELDVGGKADYEDDVVVQARGVHGVKQLAFRYSRKQIDRDLYVRAVEQAGPAQQAAFLRWVQSYMAASQ